MAAKFPEVDESVQQLLLDAGFRKLEFYGMEGKYISLEWLRDNRNRHLCRVVATSLAGLLQKAIKGS